MFVCIVRIEGAGTAFHSMRQFVWWHEECVLAVSVDDVTGQEAVVQLALEVDASKGTVRCQLRYSCVCWWVVMYVCVRTYQIYALTYSFVHCVPYEMSL